MKYIFTEHAQIRLEQRNIEEGDVIFAIEQPDILKRSFGKRILARKEIRGKVLEVVFVKQEAETVIITNYWLEEERQ